MNWSTVQSTFVAGLIVVVCGFVGWLIHLISGDWCKRLVVIEKIAGEKYVNNITDRCFHIMEGQIEALKIMGYGFVGTIATRS